MISLGSIVSYKIAKFIENVWLKFSFILSKIVPNILLTTIFIFLLTPLAILSRIFKAKTNFISSNTKKSFFINKVKVFEKKSFEKLY